MLCEPDLTFELRTTYRKRPADAIADRVTNHLCDSCCNDTKDPQQRDNSTDEAIQQSVVNAVEVPQVISTFLMSSTIPDPTHWLAADDDVEVVSVTRNDDIAPFIPGAATMVQMAPKGEGV